MAMASQAIVWRGWRPGGKRRHENVRRRRLHIHVREGDVLDLSVKAQCCGVASERAILKGPRDAGCELRGGPKEGERGG